METPDIPYVPSSHNDVRCMLDIAELKLGLRAADLGSGDGRIVLALASRGIYADGYEIDMTRARLAAQSINRLGLTHMATIYRQSFWYADLSMYDIVTLYGITSMMGRMEEKLSNELRPGAQIISNTFRFPNWAPEKSVRGIYLYKKSAEPSGTQ